jgi:hypothetical protein
MTAYKIRKIVFVILLYFLSNYQENNSVEGRIQVWNRIRNFLISGSVADPDPGSGAFWPLDPGSGMNIPDLFS